MAATIPEDLKNAGDRVTALTKECIKKGDFEGMARLYTEDCRLFIDGPVFTHVSGREELQKLMSVLYGDAESHYEVKSEELLYGGGDMAVERGTFIHVGETASKFMSEGKMIDVWKKIDGEWLIREETISANIKSTRHYIVELLFKWSKACAEGDFKAAAELYTPDGVLMYSGRPAIQGREALEKFLAERRTESEGIVQPLPGLEIDDFGEDLVAARGEFALLTKDGRQINKGGFYAVYKKLSDGKWYIHYDMPYSYF